MNSLRCCLERWCSSQLLRSLEQLSDSAFAALRIAWIDRFSAAEVAARQRPTEGGFLYAPKPGFRRASVGPGVIGGGGDDRRFGQGGPDLLNGGKVRRPVPRRAGPRHSEELRVGRSALRRMALLLAIAGNFLRAHVELHWVVSERVSIALFGSHQIDQAIHPSLVIQV